ncbi:MAG: hypothetical protein Q9222_003736, partial [Ikaeria aurantiellina]
MLDQVDMQNYRLDQIYARLRTKQLRQNAQGLGWDELFACMALLLAAGVVASIIAGVRFGMGKHQDHQTAAELVKIIQVIYSFTLLVTLCFSCLKASILCLYLRMTPEKLHRRIIYVILGIIGVNTIAVFFGNMFECTPISGFWDLNKIFKNTMPCVDIITMDIWTNSWSAFEDFVIWFLPIPVLWKLKVPSSRKAGLYTLIAISFISVTCAIVRVNSFIIWINSSDISWNFPIYPLLCTIEACVALITSSLPAIYPLFRQTAPEHRRSMVVGNPADAEQAVWNSQGSTLMSRQASNRRSRWSFLSWQGGQPPAAAKKGVDESVKSIPEEPSVHVEEEERPVTQRTMKAYFSPVEEARSSDDRTGSHRPKVSMETESLCYVGKAADCASTFTSDDEK